MFKAWLKAQTKGLKGINGSKQLFRFHRFCWQEPFRRKKGCFVLKWACVNFPSGPSEYGRKWALRKQGRESFNPVQLIRQLLESNTHLSLTHTCTLRSNSPIKWMLMFVEMWEETGEQDLNGPGGNGKWNWTTKLIATGAMGDDSLHPKS